ncbi:hypothetical protein GCM10009504_38590 [Pseudomonas laurentiana]|uniref:Uncharacterized protein n=1 Tax=Pseudomonas laurentiana TaxID=2364649 RepID=A0A6I5RPP1_9PSED|nr:hypothetical protein [Pseudomonas laurentiana]NES10124.1 hypothetical protein [Pseudomonas laurentiana]GGU77833.1 hypothetical protein GCM10009504_38590 [Pseudomonas laurentiana]
MRSRVDTGKAKRREAVVMSNIVYIVRGVVIVQVTLSSDGGLGIANLDTEGAWTSVI